MVVRCHMDGHPENVVSYFSPHTVEGVRNNNVTLRGCRSQGVEKNEQEVRGCGCWLCGGSCV